MLFSWTRYHINHIGAAMLAATATAPGLGQSPGSDIAVSITGEATAELAPLDELMTSFVSEHGVPGAALCITRHGRIVYARGFGVADRKRRETVEPTSLFRIASVTKPITATAILQLCDNDRLSLDDNPFKIIGLGDRLDDDDADHGLRDITIEHLLLHSGGWDSSTTFDPIFAGDRITETLGVASPPDHAQIIEFMLGQPLQFLPGARQEYSNFGYLLLGRVIEAVSDQSYESYVREHILTPLKINSMQLGRSLPEDRALGEVTYYDSASRLRKAAMDPTRTLPMPYTFARHISDANGGWLASAVDLVRFAGAFTDPTLCPVLSPKMCRFMNKLPGDRYSRNDEGQLKTYIYGYGWEHRPRGWDRESGPYIRSHDGRIPGTSAIVVRRADGIIWAAVFNADKSVITNRSLANTLRIPMYKTLSVIEQWPDVDEAAAPED